MNWRLGRISYTSWRPEDGKAWSRGLTLGGHLAFHSGYSDTNHHGEKYEDDSPCGYSYKTVKGWKLEWIKLRHGSAGASRRLILYLPDGSWRHWDIYVTVSRRYKTTRGFIRAQLTGDGRRKVVL